MLNRLKGVFEFFHQHRVKYVVIGGIAAVLYGVPRATFDLDILIESTPKNVRRLLIEDLIRSKRAAGRDIDLEDARLLELPDNEDPKQHGQ